MAAKLQCEICGGKLIGKPGGIFECENCGTEYSTEWAKAKIQEITGTVKVEGTVEVTGKVQVDSSANKEALLRRGKLALEDSEWAKAKEIFIEILDADPENAEAYFGLCMAEEKCCDKEAFQKKYSAIDFWSRIKDSKNLIRARQFSSEYESWLSNMDTQRRQEIDQLEKERKKEMAEPILFMLSNAPACRTVCVMLDDAGFTYRKILANENMELTNRLGIRQVPTLVLPDGTKYVGPGTIKLFLKDRL